MSVLFLDDYIANDHLERGLVYLRANRFEESILEFNKTLSITPNDSYAHWNKATALLSIGDYENGFAEHDRGWCLFDWRGFGPVGDDIDRVKLLPMWRGEDISSQNLLVYHELGYGDAIMTLRYLPELRNRAERVTLVIDSCLTGLAEQYGVEVVTKVPGDLGEYDCRIPFFGVLSALKQTVQNIPRNPYVNSEWWSKRERGRVGIAWSGRTQTEFTLPRFLSMFDHNKYSLNSLQHSPVTDDVIKLRTKTFIDTVNLISRMQHIVTVDTAAAHLAGAVGHPSVHLLLPFSRDWRWWNTNVWYPTIKTYPQESPGDWSIPFASLNATLKEFDE